MLQSRSFWILFTLVAVASTALAFVYFPRAFPLVSLDLSMDREMALTTARNMAVGQDWGPSEFRQAASFGLDSRVQNYVELEAGGNDAFRKMINEGRYAPYTWRVRHFKEGETLETSILFTPAGRPYGFSQKLSEDAPGASIGRDEAQSVAEQTAIDVWKIDWSEYELVEASQEVRPGGRTDHTFVYRLRNEMIGEGEYRLRLVVGGDNLTALTHFVKVPEAFSRRYQEMRSANDTIARVAGIAIVVFYILGGCLVGLFFLLRHKWILPRPAFLWGFFIAFLQVLAAINQWPLLWMSYDTALSSESFLMRQAVGLLALFFGMGLTSQFDLYGSRRPYSACLWQPHPFLEAMVASGGKHSVGRRNDGGRLSPRRLVLCLRGRALLLLDTVARVVVALLGAIQPGCACNVLSLAIFYC